MIGALYSNIFNGNYLDHDVLMYLQGGLSTRDEMCLSFLVYYPRTSLTVCQSFPTVGAFVPFVTNYVPQ